MILKRQFGTVLLALSVLVLLEGCATRSSQGHFVYDSGVPGSAGGFPEQTADPFQVVQEASGLGEEARHPAGAALYLGQARELLGHMARTRITAKSFAPRRVLYWLLREVLEGGERVDYAELKWRTERFWLLVLVRPDGYLVTALTGTPLQRLGPMELKGGEWTVGSLTVGDFYFSRAGVFYPVTEALRPADGPPLAELGLGRDPVNAALDGAQEAMGEMAVALAQSIRHPLRTTEDLAQLPTTVAYLIASSPEYFARYGTMSWEDQIREAARLSTHVIMMRGGTQATMGRMGGLGAELPVLSLTVRGELVLGGAVVVEGTTATAVAVDLGALSILHMASRGQGDTGSASGNTEKPTKAASARGPGRWTYKKPTTNSKTSLDYQEQVTGRPAWYVYMVEGLEFDGIKGKVLLEAKGPGYCSFFNPDGTPKYWYKNSGKFEEMMRQAGNQSKIAQHLGLSVIWHVADAKVAEFLRKEFKTRELHTTTVHHTPPAR